MKRENWGSKLGFILAATGSAIGLGNIWKFPYIAGENGGAAFIFIYLICIAIIGLPVLNAEILLGRTTQRNPVGAFRALSSNRAWVLVGGIGVAAGFMILSFYSVIAGWSLGYIFEVLRGGFTNMTDATAAADHFGSLVGNVGWNLGFMIGFFALTIAVVYLGVQNGIERGSKIMMPVLFIILLVLVIRGITLEGSGAGMQFLWHPDWSKITAESVLVALGHAFFTLSLGMGAMMTYGSYMSEKDSIPSAALQVAFLDTLIAILAGIAIFTAVFATGQDPAAGPGLIFQTLPVVFAKMPGGIVFGLLFFLLLTIAALTSAISLLEVVTAYFVDERGWQRHRAVLVFGLVIMVVAIPSALSFNLLADATLWGKTFFDLIDFLASNILLPAGGLAIAVFVAWSWGFKKALPKLRIGAETLFDNYPARIAILAFFLKYVSPILIFLVLLNSTGLLSMITAFFTN